MNTLTYQSYVVWTTPKGTHASCPCYMESCPGTALIYATSTSTIQKYLPTSQSLQALRRCNNILYSDTEGIQCNCHHQHRQFCADHHFRLDSIRRFGLDLTHSSRIYLAQFFNLIQLTVLVKNLLQTQRNDTIDLRTLGHFCVPKIYPNVDFKGCLK